MPALLESSNGDGVVRRDQTSDLQLPVDSTPSPIHTSRPEGYLDFFNQTWVTYVGRPLEDLQDWKWTAFIHPDDVEGIVEKWRVSLASGEPFLHDARVRRADGEYRWMLHHKVAVRDGCGQIVKWLGSTMDIEDRKREEEQLHRSSQEVQRSEIYLAEGQQLAHMGSWVFDSAGFDYWSPDLFRMHGLDPARKPPTIQDYLNCVHPQDRESMASLIEGLWERVSPFDATKRIVRPNGEVRYIRCVGAPIVDNESLKKWVGSALDVTEHELAAQELRRREAYLAEAQRLSHTGSFGWRPGGGEIVWSDETYRIFEYENTLRPTVDLAVQRIHPQDRAPVQQVIDHASQTGTDFEHEYRLLLPDGRVKHVHAIAHAVLNVFGDREFIGAVTDITERKTFENKIRRLVDANILGIFIGDVEGERIVDANETFLGMLQYTREDLVSRRMLWADLTPPEWHERDKRELASVKATGAVQPYEKELFRKDGSRVPVLVGGALFEGGSEGVSFVLDLSEQKRAEQKIREQEAALRQILDFTPHYLAVVGADGTPIYANRASLDYIGMSLDEWLQRKQIGEECHPDDLQRLISEIDRAFTTGSPVEMEERVRKGDGSFRWCLTRCNPVRDESGRITRLYLASTDIHDRKSAEERLQRENVVLREEIDKASMFEEIVGTSKSLKAVLSRIAKVAPTDSTVLIAGETGTGKELIARAVHKRSRRAGRAFISVNCAALPPTLVSSELFGMKRELLREPRSVGSAASKWLTTGRFSWTKWANSCPTPKPRY
jgi:PAS domain S-box-containing protein